MRAFIVSAVILLTVIFTGQGYAQVNFGVSVGDRNGFYLEMGNYYGVPQHDVMVVHERRIDDDDLPVVFFIARSAGVPPVVVADLRRDGWSWREIAFHFRLDPAVFYMPAYGGPYGVRYHSYLDWRRNNWRDEDFIRFANVRFISEHYRCDPGDVMRMRSQHRNFYMIHNDVYRESMNRGWDRGYRHDNGNHNGWYNHDRGGDNGGHNGWYNHDRGGGNGWKDRQYNDNNRGDNGGNRPDAPRGNDSRTRHHGRERE